MNTQREVAVWILWSGPHREPELYTRFSCGPEENMWAAFVSQSIDTPRGVRVGLIEIKEPGLLKFRVAPFLTPEDVI